MKQEIWRYAELEFRSQKLKQEGKDLNDTERAEMDALRTRLGLTHEQILERAASGLIDDSCC